MANERRLISLKELWQSIRLNIVQPFVTTQALVSATPTQTVTTINTTSSTVLAANANRKHVMFQSQGVGVAAIYIHFGASPATVTNSVELLDGQSYEFPEGLVFTGEVRAVTASSTKVLYVEEWT